MNNHLLSYALYLAITITLTFWVGRVLFNHGRLFLVEIFKGNAEFADAVNRLLIVGFYLVNFGYVSLVLREAAELLTIQDVVERLSGKVGIIILILGAMHFFNLYVLFKLRKRAKMEELTTQPVKRETIQAQVPVQAQVTTQTNV
jgi:hypothetical protein